MNLMDNELKDTIPPMYSTEYVEFEDKMIYAHYYIKLPDGQFDWWVCEYEPTERMFFGYANLNNPQNAEWGYISLDELEDLGLVEREANFKPAPAKQLGFLER